MRPGRLRRAGALALEALREWIRDRCDDMASGLAFNALLAIGPLVGVIVAVSWKLLGETWTRSRFLPAVLTWIGPHGEKTVRTLLVESEHLSATSVVTIGAAGVLSLVLGASGYFLQLQDALETVWGVRREDARLRVQAAKRARGFVYAAVSSMFLLAGFAAEGVVAGPAAARGLGIEVELFVTFLTSWALTSYWLAALPPVRLTLRQILPWSAASAAFNVVGRSVLSLHAAAQYEPAAVESAVSLLLTLLWFYYSSMAFLYCAETMRVYLQQRGIAGPSEVASDLSVAVP